MTWAAGPYLSFDLETSGVDVENDRVVTAAIVDIRPGQPVRTRTWLVNPGIDIPAGATAVHGITTEQARADGVHPSTALDEISLEIETAIASGIPLVAMNERHNTEDPRDMRIAEITAATAQVHATLAVAASQMRSLPAEQADKE